MIYDADILAIPWKSRGAALIYFTVRLNPVLFEMPRRSSRDCGCRVTTL